MKRLKACWSTINEHIIKPFTVQSHIFVTYNILVLYLYYFILVLFYSLLQNIKYKCSLHCPCIQYTYIAYIWCTYTVFIHLSTYVKYSLFQGSNNSIWKAPKCFFQIILGKSSPRRKRLDTGTSFPGQWSWSLGEVMEFKKHLNKDLRIWSGPAWSQELELMILVGPF